MIYLNEIDPFAARWMQRLMDAGEIPSGHIDQRSIKDVQPADLDGYNQCHFFAGIAGWSQAIKIAQWPDALTVWSGSCPCQSVSGAGKRKGEKDERHLWPEFYRLISECRPAIVVGEQTASGDGPEWLDGISLDLEELGYAVGTSDLPAAGVKSPQGRQRLWWVAIANSFRYDWRESSTIARESKVAIEAEANCAVGGLGNTIGNDLGRNAGAAPGAKTEGGSERQEHGDRRHESGHASAVGESSWSDFTILPMLDGKQRRIERGSFPLAHGLPRSVGPGSTRDQRMELMAAKANRTGRLRGYGNAIVPDVAAVFLRQVLEILSD